MIYTPHQKEFCSKCKLNKTCQHNFDYQCSIAYSHLYNYEKSIQYFKTYDSNYIQNFKKMILSQKSSEIKEQFNTIMDNLIENDTTYCYHSSDYQLGCIDTLKQVKRIIGNIF